MVIDLGDTPRPKAGMQCPHCHVDLMMTSRETIEIDYCPKCRGVWLDRGELDKIIERSMAGNMPQPAPQTASRDKRRKYDDDDDDDYKRRKYRKKSWIAEIFDELT